MIDSLCHLTAKEFTNDIDAVLQRAREAGIENFVTIADCIEDIALCRAMANRYDSIFFTAGVHPHHASNFSDEDFAIIRSSFDHPKCRAVGEIGLDYHYMHSPKDTQQRAFEKQLVLAKDLNVPAVVHCRDAMDDLWTIVKHVSPPRIVLHCCTEQWNDVKRYVDAGHFLSFTGIATYPKSEDIRATIATCPIERMMIETDAPYLAPVPHRGGRNEPAYVAEVLKLVASIKEIDLVEADRITTANTVEFFGL